MTLTLAPRQSPDQESEALIREARRLQRRRWRLRAGTGHCRDPRGSGPHHRRAGRRNPQITSIAPPSQPAVAKKGERTVTGFRHFVPIDGPDGRRRRFGRGRLFHRWQPGVRGRADHGAAPGRRRNGSAGLLGRRWTSFTGQADLADRHRRGPQRRRLFRRRQPDTQGFRSKRDHLDRCRQRSSGSNWLRSLGTNRQWWSRHPGLIGLQQSRDWHGRSQQHPCHRPRRRPLHRRHRLQRGPEGVTDHRHHHPGDRERAPLRSVDGICIATIPPCEPVGVAVDRSSDVFVATACDTVREVSGTTGAISTISRRANLLRWREPE